MPNLFEPSRVQEIRERLGRVRADSERQWGTMTAPQAIAHCAIPMEMAVGDRKPSRMFIGRLIGPMVKRLAIGNDAPLRRNAPTDPRMVVSDERDLDVERQRLIDLVDRFAAGGRAGCTTHPHSFFGRMTPEEWATLMYKHIDHHLRQFGA